MRQYDKRLLRLLEEDSIQWRRDWDALTIGFLLGALSMLAAALTWRLI